MTFQRPPWRAALTAAVLAALVPLAVITHARWQESLHLKVGVGLFCLLLCSLLPVLIPSRNPARLTKWTLAASLFSAGTVVAGLVPVETVGPVAVAPLVHAVSLLGVLIVTLQQLHNARTTRDDQSLMVEAVLFAAIGSTIAWDVVIRSGSSGNGWWTASTLTVILVGCLLGASSCVLAIEHPRLRTANSGIAAASLGTVVAAIGTGDHLGVAQFGVALGPVAAVILMLFQPRGDLVRHGGLSAAKAARRLRAATMLPAVALLADLCLFAVSPRMDRVMFTFVVALVVIAALRQAVSARVIDRTRERLSFQALHDQLTGLENRAALASALTEPDRRQSLVILEVGGLDDVTDVLGVTVGEEVLRAAATNLREHVTSVGGSTYRVRHDEFAVLFPGAPDETVKHLPAALSAISAAPLQVTGAGRFPVEAVAGVSCVDPGVRLHGDAMVPLVHADLALRDARANSAGPGWSVYSGDVAAAHARRLLVRERLSRAIAEGSVDVHFQPIVDFTTGKVVKFEALARWDDAELGRISPVEFIAVAEESNLVVALGEHVLRKAVGAAHSAGVFSAGVRLAVNVSVVQLQSPGFADVVREILASYAIPSHLLTLELTESVFLDEDSPAERVVTELAGLGCQIAIDDFGTGYSAFGYLDRLPVHVLKIDRSLTQSLTGAGNGRSVVTAVVDLANRLGLTVVVEGVETPEEAEICRAIQAGLGQGWLYSAAVTSDRIVAELEREYPVSPGAVR